MRTHDAGCILVYFGQNINEYLMYDIFRHAVSPSDVGACGVSVHTIKDWLPIEALFMCSYNTEHPPPQIW